MAAAFAIDANARAHTQGQGDGCSNSEEENKGKQLKNALDETDGVVLQAHVWREAQALDMHLLVVCSAAVAVPRNGEGLCLFIVQDVCVGLLVSLFT